MRRDSGLGKSPPSFDSSSEEPWRDSFTSPISSLKFSHKVLVRLAHASEVDMDEVLLYIV